MASRHKNIPIKLFKTPVLFLIKLFVEILTLRLEKSLSGEESLLLFQSSSSNTQVKTLTSSRGPTASFDCYGCLHTHVTLKTHTFIYINKNKIKNKSSLEHWLALLSLVLWRQMQVELRFDASHQTVISCLKTKTNQ